MLVMMPKTGSLIYCWWGCKVVWQPLKKFNMQLSYDPAIAVLGIYPRETKTSLQTKTCTHMLIAAL